MSRRMLLALVAVALQLGVLGFMAGQREWIARTGRSVWLRTAPIDPQDAMRGDYARLDYNISHVPTDYWTGLADRKRDTHGRFRGDLPLYASLTVAEDGVAELNGVSEKRPAEGLFLRARTEPSWSSELRLRYGIEALFMQQGKAKELEDQRRGQMSGVPLRVEVAVSPGGTAVLKSWKWESLGLTLDLVSTNGPGQFGPRRAVVGANLVLKNHGPEELAIVDLPGNGSFALLGETGWDASRPLWVNASNTPAKPRAQNVVLLKPGQSHTNRIDLLQPEWFVLDSKATNPPAKPMSLADLTQNRGWSFRFQYRPPAAAECVGLPDAQRIWHGRLLSRRAWATGGVD